MRMNEPIHIDLQSFFLEGSFDHIEVGQTKDWISNNFADPDSAFEDRHGCSIWNFGSLEFHFDHDVLFLIWCDNFDGLECEQLTFAKWIIGDGPLLTLPFVLQALNSACANYVVHHDRALGNAQLRIEKSRVVFHFEPLEDENGDGDPNTYQMIGFGLSHRDYDTFEKDRP